MNDSDKQWAEKRVKHINGLSKPTDNQTLFVELMELDKADALDRELRAGLNALIKSEKRVEKAEQGERDAIAPVAAIVARKAKQREICRNELGDWVLDSIENSPKMREWVLKNYEERSLNKEKSAAFHPLLKDIKALESSSAGELSTSRDAAKTSTTSIADWTRQNSSSSTGAANT